MQQQEDCEVYCPKHGLKILTVEERVPGEIQYLCFNCLTDKQTPFEKIKQQLKDLRSRKIQNLIENGKNSERRLGSLKKLFLTIKEQFNQTIEDILKSISDAISQMKEQNKQEQEKLSQPINQLPLQQISAHIVELNTREQKDNDIYRDKDDQLRYWTIKKYLENVKQWNNLIKQGSDWNIFRLCLQKKITGCQAMAINQDERIFVNGQDNFIQIWEVDQQGTMILKQTLNEHMGSINTLCFSKKGQWFISGGADNRIKLWKLTNNYWNCHQTIVEPHMCQIFEIALNNEEDQFVSCSDDQIINVWMKQRGEIDWKCVQTLKEHTDQIIFMSQSPDDKLLASSGIDALRIWQLGSDKQWSTKQVIQNTKSVTHLRISFTHNTELIASTSDEGSLYTYTQNYNGKFVLKSQLKLSSTKEQDIQIFPLIYNKLQGLVILRHSSEHTYILKQGETGEFSVHQVLDGDYASGLLLRNGKCIIIYDKRNQYLEVMKQ